MRRLLLLSLLLCGCPLSHGDYPGTACEQNSDCFASETCSGGQCIPKTDAAAITDGPARDRPIDSPVIDGGIDAPDMPDGGM